jgi:hypothetical protein
MLNATGRLSALRVLPRSADAEELIPPSLRICRRQSSLSRFLQLCSTKSRHSSSKAVMSITGADVYDLPRINHLHQLFGLWFSGGQHLAISAFRPAPIATASATVFVRRVFQSTAMLCCASQLC